MDSDWWNQCLFSSFICSTFIFFNSLVLVYFFFLFLRLFNVILILLFHQKRMVQCSVDCYYMSVHRTAIAVSSRFWNRKKNISLLSLVFLSPPHKFLFHFALIAFPSNCCYPRGFAWINVSDVFLITFFYALDIFFPPLSLFDGFCVSLRCCHHISRSG